MSSGGSKRAVAEIRFGEDRAGVAKVGGRSIHQYWTMLSPHFRDVFLAPQRRSDDGGVSWTWREPAEKQPPTAAELVGVRNRLERAKESFEENPVSPLMSEARGGGASSQEIIDQLTVRVKALAEGLAGKPDAALAEYVCRTETGVMVHSWGLTAAAKISYPDSQESAVSGVVLFGGKGSAGNDVVIENARGLRVARTTTDDAGEFSFTKLTPGKYQVRVISGPGEFSKKGVPVTVERGETSRIELRSTSDPEAPSAEGAEESAGQSATDTSAPVAAGKSRIWIWIAVVVVLLLLGGGGWVWRAYFRSDGSDTQSTQRISTLTPEDYSQAKPSVHNEATTRAGNGVGAGLGAVVDGPGETKSPTMQRETPSIDLPAFSSNPSATAGSVSKIGTHVELSGADRPGVSNSPTSGATNVALGATSRTEGKPVSTDNLSSLAEARAGAEADSDSRRENSTAVSATTPKTEAEARSSTGGAPKENLTGHMPAGKGGAMPESPAGSEVEKQQGMAVDIGLASDDKKKGSSKASGLPATDRAKKGVSSGDNVAASSNGGAASGGPGARQIAGQGPAVAVTVVEKPANKSQTPVVTGDGKPASPPEDSSSPSESTDDTPAGAGKPKASNDRKAETKKSTPQSGADSGNSFASTDSTSASPTVASSKGEASKKEKDETSNTAKKSSAVSSSAAAASDGVGDKTPTSTSDQKGDEKTTRTARAAAMVQSKPLPAGMQIMGTVKLGEWSLRLGRDAIVPTLPLRDGEKDLTGTLRRKMIEEQMARLPATLRRPKLLGGFAFKFAAGAKVQPLRWLIEGGPGMTLVVRDNRAEIDWPLASAPREGLFALAYSDGTEVARVVVDRAGRATVAVRPELKAVLLFGALYAESDYSGNRDAPRVTWQVVRGPLASTAWTYDSRWLEGMGCRLEAVLNGANPAHTRIALIDQSSGWQLATELE